MSGIVGTLHGSRECDVTIRDVAAEKSIDALIVDWEEGATLEQIESILGHLTAKEGRQYIQQARRRVMAADGTVSEKGS
jgi:hypothetical protein